MIGRGDLSHGAAIYRAAEKANSYTYIMKLSDNEIRDITKLLKAGKQLPEKYRFLLFEEKHEVELVLSGKTNEVCIDRRRFISR